MSGVDIDAVHYQTSRDWHGQRQVTLAVRQWFLANPGELLSYDDIAAKFDVPRSTAHAAVDTLRSEGLVYSAVMVGLDPERGSSR